MANGLAQKAQLLNLDIWASVTSQIGNHSKLITYFKYKQQNYSFVRNALHG